jgi:predicted alpha/beta superfamily hydrolase
MIRFYLPSMSVIFLFICFSGLNAQTAPPEQNPVNLDNTVQFPIISKYVKNEKYIIQVGLPIGYKNSDKSYPVLYVLDGDKSFGMTKEITDWLSWDNEIKNIIVVGISYGKGTSIWWEKRARDYTQFKDTVYYYYPNAGGADNFLSFIKNELFPVINKNYRTKQDSNAIMGISFGALLSSYVLFTQPDMFKDYILISPSLFWNGNSILKTESDYFLKHKELNKTVYLAYGSQDDNDWVIGPTTELIQIIQEHKYDSLKFITQVFKGETHISVYPVAMTHGLKTIFRR